jgi:hypothetical protein
MGIPRPAEYVFPESHSVHSQVDFKKQNIFYYLLTSRGCTYKCNFCWEVARTAALKDEMARDGVAVDLTWRAHSEAWVDEQLTYLERRLAENGAVMDGVGLWDDMIFGREKEAHIQRAKRIFSGMRERNYGYLLEARASQLMGKSQRWNDAGVMREADLYQFLKDTGCMQVFVGTESANQQTLNLIQKGTKAIDYGRLVEISRDIGLPLRFSLIVGFPDESDRSVNETLDLIERLAGRTVRVRQRPEDVHAVSGNASVRRRCQGRAEGADRHPRLGADDALRRLPRALSVAGKELHAEHPGADRLGVGARAGGEENAAEGRRHSRLRPAALTTDGFD